MDVLEQLRFAATTMKRINAAHNHEIFMDIQLVECDLELRFDIMNSFSHHAMDLARILNLTYYPYSFGNKILHTIIP